MTEEVIDAPVDNNPAPAPVDPAPAPPAPPAADLTPAPAPADPAPSDPPKQIWPDDWRDQMLGKISDAATPEEKAEFDKLQKMLQRFNSPADLAKKAREQDKYISSGSVKKPLPKDAKPEDIAKWRAENGIPESPDKYELKLAQGIEITERDKPLVDKFLADMHSQNAAPEVVNAAVNSFMSLQKDVAAKLAEVDSAAKAATEDELRAEWGGDFRTNVQGVDSMLGQAGEEIQAALLNARGPDGARILNNPAVMRWLAGHARELGYVGATVVPSGGDLGKSIDDEIKAIEASMFDANGNRSADYWKSEKAQARYSQLLETRARRESK